MNVKDAAQHLFQKYNMSYQNMIVATDQDYNIFVYHNLNEDTFYRGNYPIQYDGYPVKYVLMGKVVAYDSESGKSRKGS